MRKQIVIMLIFCATFSQASSHRQSTSKLLAPSHQSLLRQNLCADQMGLKRIQNEVELQSLVASGTLQALPNDGTVQIAPSLPENRRYALPLTVSFLHTLAVAYRERFGKPLVITSAVRPVETQVRLRKQNRSAAPAEGETASSHERGATIDLSKNLTGEQLRWLRNVLSYEVVMNRAVVEEERHCLHIEVIGETE